MEKRLYINFSRTVFAILLLLWACSAQRQESENSEADNTELTNSQTAGETKSAVPVFEKVDAKVKAQMNGFLLDYFALNQMLIADNLNGAKTAAKKLTETVNKFDMANLTGEQMDFYLTQVSKLNQGLKEIDESADIEKTRIALATLSEGMYALAKAYRPNEAALYYQFCPMARNGEGANWLSSTKEIVNPYMGQMMPECGRTEEILHELGFPN